MAILLNLVKKRERLHKRKTALVFRQLYTHCRILTSRSQTSDGDESNENLQGLK